MKEHGKGPSSAAGFAPGWEEGEEAANTGREASGDSRKKEPSPIAPTMEILQFYRAILDNAPWAISVKDRQGRFQHANNQFQQWHGISGKEWLGKTSHEILPPKYADADCAVDREVLETGQAGKLVLEVPFADDTLHWIVVSKFPVFDLHGERMGVGAIITDCTENKRLERVLAKSEELLRNVVDNFSSSLFITDLEGRFRLVNQAIQYWHGLTEEQVLGRTSHEIFPKDLADRYVLQDREVLAEGKPVIAEQEIQLADRTRRTVMSNKFPIYSLEGELTGIGNINIDISNQLRMEKELLAKEKILHAMVESAPVVIIMANEKGIVQSVNSAFNSLFGYQPEEIVGRNVNKLMFSPDREVHDSYLEKFLADKNKSTTNIRRQVRGRRKDGSVIHLEANFGYFQIDNQHIFTGFLTDITERIEAEESLRNNRHLLQTVIDALPLWLFVKDRYGNYLLVNRKMADDIGTDPESFKDMSFFDAPQGTEQERYEVWREDLNVLSTENLLDIPERTTTLPDGREIVHHVIISPLRDKWGKVIGTVGIAEDISEKKSIEEQLRQAQKMEAIGQLTGGLAHDFNNLLTIMLGNLELLQEEVAGLPCHIYVERSIQALERGANLTQRLLAFSRNQLLNPQLTDIDKLISNLVQLLQRTLGEDIQIETVLRENPNSAYVDSHQLENAILNLSVNARDAMPGGGKLTIETENTYLDEEYAKIHPEVTPGEYVRIIVSDTGTGMTPEVVSRAFEPFFTTKEVGRGTGLGLSMVFGFLKQSGGHIKICSQVNKGTSIRIYFPSSQDQIPSAEEEEFPRDALPRGNGEKILVVEDDSDVRQQAMEVLMGFGYQPIEAEDAAAALAILDEQQDIELLFTDVVLKGAMNGVGLAREAQGMYPGIKVLFTSGYFQNAIIHNGFFNGGIEFIKKPFRRADFLTRLQEILGKAGK